jgi:hypothetical protein
MGTKKRGNFTRDGEDVADNSLAQTRRDAIGQAVAEVIERERRNLQRTSAVLASLTVAVMFEEDQIAADDVAYVAREVIDAAVEALDLVELDKAIKRYQADEQQQ